MNHKILQNSIILIIFLFAVFVITAKAAKVTEVEETKENVFEESQKTASRESLEFYGGNVEDLAVAPDGNVYVGLNSANGIFYSSDGATWNAPPAGSDFGTGNAVEASEESIFVNGGINLYRSQDSGGSWEQLSPQDVSSTLHFGQEKLFVGMRDGTLKISEDEGETFTDVTVDEAIGEFNSIASSASNSDVWLLGRTTDNTSMLYKSTDGGLTWGNTGVTAEGSAVEIFVKPTDPNFLVMRATGMLASTDGGQTWNTILTDYTGRATWSGGRLYVGLYFSDDDGATWSQMSSGDAANLGSKIAVDPNNPDRMFIDSHVGMAKTEDGGTTWMDMNEGLFGVVVNDIAQYSNKAIVWLATDSGLAKTENFQNENPIWEFPISPGGVDFTTAVWVNAEDSNQIAAAGGNKMYYSFDGGGTWTELTGDFGDGTGTDFQSGNGVLYGSYVSGDANAADGGVLAITTANENTVTATDTGLDGVPVNALATDSQGNLYAASGGERFTEESTRGIYKYDGVTWEKLSGAASSYLVNDILVIDDIIFAAAGETSKGAIFRSSDFGETWENLDEENGLPSGGWFHALAVESFNSQNLYVSTARPAGTSYIYKSMDGGDTWSLFYTGLIDERFLALLFDGLTTGTDTGLYTYSSKVKLNLAAADNSIAKNQAIKLTATLKDASTKTVLKNRTLRFYRKTKDGSWKYFAKAKTNKLGRVSLTAELQKTTFFQARFKPTSQADKASYSSLKKSGTIKIKVR